LESGIRKECTYLKVRQAESGSKGSGKMYVKFSVNTRKVQKGQMCYCIRRQLYRMTLTEMDLREIGKDAVNWIYLVQDRAQGLWRTK
jgi:hypothetical protein